MKLKSIILLTVLLSFIAFKKENKKTENLTKNHTVLSEQISKHIIAWKDAINSNNINTIESGYDANAIKIISEDSIISTASQIANYYKKQDSRITSIESLFSIEANTPKAIHYEIVKYKINDHKEYIQVVIWRMENQHVIREFEFTEENTLESAIIDTTNISERRKLWIELCNLNNSENLVKQLYTSNTMYFNHRPLVKGVNDLIKEYSYMNNENYSLKLSPLKLEMVNANFAFEIGQCSGSYNGKYMLIWKKQADGIWKIYIDSNI